MRHPSGAALLRRATMATASVSQQGHGSRETGAWPAWAYWGAAAATVLATAATVSEQQQTRGRFALTSGATRCEEVKKPPLVTAFPPCMKLAENKVSVYQFESCPFCRKVRACLDYHKVPYELVEVNPLTKAETKPISPDYQKVPILHVWVSEGRELQMRDSKTIVSALLGDKNPGVAKGVPLPGPTKSTGKMWAKDGEVTGTVEEQWVRWTDLVLVQCIVLNVYRNMAESAETFDYLLTHPSFPWYAQRGAAFSGTVVMWGVAKSRKKKFQVPDEREALYEAIELFASAVKAGGGAFMGGKTPGAVDFNVYGILRSAECCQTERDFFEKCPNLWPWYTAMQEAVGPSMAGNKDSVKRGS